MKLTMFNIVISKKKKILLALMLALLQFLQNIKTVLHKFSILQIKNKHIQIESIWE